MFLFDWITSVLAYFGFKKNVKLLVTGLDNAGKTTLLQMLSIDRMAYPAQMPKGPGQEIDVGSIRFIAYDLGGSYPQGVRGWKGYYPVDGIIFMVDSADPTRFDEAREELDRTMRDNTMSDAPIAILFNKIDKKEAVSEEYLSEKLKLGEHRTGKKHIPRAELIGRPLETFPISIVKRVGYGDAIRWLAYYTE